MVSDAQKKARDKWDAKNMKLVGVRLRRDKADAFRLYAQQHGTTPNAILKDYILRLLDGFDPDAAPPEIPGENDLY